MSRRPKLRTVPVHPNSMAARKWRRTSWTTWLDPAELQTRAPAMAGAAASLTGDPTRALFRRAARAAERGDLVLAAALRAAAMRASRTEHRCG